MGVLILDLSRMLQDKKACPYFTWFSLANGGGVVEVSITVCCFIAVF